MATLDFSLDISTALDLFTENFKKELLEVSANVTAEQEKIKNLLQRKNEYVDYLERTEKLKNNISVGGVASIDVDEYVRLFSEYEVLKLKEYRMIRELHDGTSLDTLTQNPIFIENTVAKEAIAIEMDRIYSKLSIADNYIQAIDAKIAVISAVTNDLSVALETAKTNIANLIEQQKNTLQIFGAKKIEDLATLEFDDQELINLYIASFTVDPSVPVDIRVSAITYVTKDIFIVSKKGKDIPHNFGKFKVTLNVNTGMLKCTIVPIYERTPYPDHFHPHINTAGTPCWGDAGTAILASARAQDFGSVILLVHNFLKQYNNNSAYRRLNTWVPNCYDDPSCDICEELYIDCTCQFCVYCNRTDQLLDCGYCRTCHNSIHKTCKTSKELKTGINGTGCQFSSLFKNCEVGNSIYYCQHDVNGNCTCKGGADSIKITVIHPVHSDKFVCSDYRLPCNHRN